MAETIGVKVAEIKGMVKGLCDQVEKLDHRLFGNGQQGVIKDLEASQQRIREEFDRRINKAVSAQEVQAKLLSRIFGKPGIITAAVWILLNVLLLGGVIDLKTFVKAIFH